MKQYPVCHTKVIGGEFNDSSITNFEKLLHSHNFVNRIDIVLNSEQSNNIEKSLSTEEVENLIILADFNQLLKFLLSLDKIDRTHIKLVTLDKDITHENTIFINDGIMTLKLCSDIYLKSGFQFKKSSFSYGNKNLKSQMYIHDFDLSTLEENIKSNNKNYIRLLWFAENIIFKQFKFMLSYTKKLNESLKDKISTSGIKIQKYKVMKPEVYKMDNCLLPELSIEPDEDKLTEILEWLDYAAIRGYHLTSSVDPFISRYPTMIDSQSKINLKIISISNVLMNLNIKKHFFKALTENANWFAIKFYGVKDVTRAFRKSNEHSFVDDGINNITLFVNDKKYAVWTTVDNGDSI